MKSKKRLDSQRAFIESYLLKGKSITPKEALDFFGCFRLAAVIHVLKRDHNIQKEMVKKSRGCYYACYSIPKD